jgi:N-acetylglucosaminyldiphosphoundecaprenol N-acetyl-beta-D-mannosaminyltransferase
MNLSDAMPISRVVGMRVDPLTYGTAVRSVVAAAREARSSYVCVANVHMVMEAYDDPSFEQIVANALLVTPDGQPLVWALGALGNRGVERVYGPTLTLHVCAAAEREALPIALYGGTEQSLDSFTAFLAERYPALRVVCRIAPPFRPPTPDEDAADTRRLAESGARIVLVGIGCPKQERWMAAHKGRIPAVMLGVGAAFDFHSGRVRQAPAALQRVGLEWAFRLVMEPRRLWKRYLRHNPRFVALFIVQWMRHMLSPRSVEPAWVVRPRRASSRRRAASVRRAAAFGRGAARRAVEPLTP